MALSRQWYTTANLAASDTSTATLLAKSILWAWKAFLKGEVSGTNGAEGARPSSAYWTCESSSDGAGNFNLAGTDLWTSSFDATKINRATAGSNHSWIVLKSPANLGPIYMLIDWSTSADTTVTIRYSYNAFSTGGTATAAPTSTGSWVHTADGSATVTVTFNDGTATAHKLHFVTDADGAYHFLTSKNTSGIFHVHNSCMGLVETRTGDTKTVMTTYHYSASGRGAGKLNAITGGSIGSDSWGQGGSRSAGNTNPTIIGGRTCDNSAVAISNALTYMQHRNGTVYSMGNTSVGADDNAWLSQINGADSKWDFLPIFVFTTNLTVGGTRGRFPDMAYVPTGTTVGGGAPSAASQERCVVGNLMIPFSVAPSL